MAIIVHHLENSRSQRILWMLEELGLDYEVRRYARNRKTMLAPPELKQVHPLGKSPVIEDGDAIVAETGAIVEYLVEKADGRLGPPGHRPSVLRYRHFLHYAEGSMMPPLLALLVVVHAFVPRRLRWGEELPRLSLVNRQIFEVHTFFIVLVLALSSTLLLTSSDALLAPSRLSRALLRLGRVEEAQQELRVFEQAQAKAMDEERRRFRENQQKIDDVLKVR